MKKEPVDHLRDPKIKSEKITENTRKDPNIRGRLEKLFSRKRSFVLKQYGQSMAYAGFGHVDTP